MKKTILITLIFLALISESFSQTDFVKYFDGKIVDIESADFEDDVLFINDEKVNQNTIALISLDGNLQANVYRVDASKLRTVTNLNTDYLFADRTIKGRMNMFEYYLTKGSKRSRFPRQFFNLGNEGDVKIASVKNLYPHFEKNSLSMKYLKKAKTSKLMKTISFWGTVGLVTVGATILANGYETTPGLAAGGSVMGLGFVLGGTYAIFPFEKIKRKNIAKAIETY